LERINFGLEFISLCLNISVNLRTSGFSSLHEIKDISACDSNGLAGNAINDSILCAGKDTCKFTEGHVVTDLSVSFKVNFRDRVVSSNFTFAQSDHQVSGGEHTSERAVFLKHDKYVRFGVSHHLGSLSGGRVD
jgi:hypothetical protein